MSTEYPKRRHDDCPNFEDHHIRKLKSMSSMHISKAFIDYLVASAAVAVLVLVFHVHRTLKHLNDNAAALMPAMLDQNHKLDLIHESLHAEATSMRATMEGKGNVKPAR